MAGGTNAMNMTKQALVSPNMTEEDIFASMLGSYSIVDIGVLINMETTSRGFFGAIECSRAGSKDIATVYTGVELLTIGNSMGGLEVPPSGNDKYLCFCPRTAMADTLSGEPLDGNSRQYTIQGMKAIPVVNMARSEGARFGIDAVGAFYIEADGLRFNLGPGALCTLSDDIGNIISLDPSSGIYISLYNGTIVFQTVVGGTWSLTYRGDDTKVLSWEQHKPDGSQIQRWGYKAVFTHEELQAGVEAYALWTREEKTLADGTKTITEQNIEGDEPIVVYMEELLPDDTKTIMRADPEGNILTNEVWNPDGSYKYTQTDADGNVIRDKEIAADSSVTYLHNNADGDALANISLPADGSISISLLKEDITLTIAADGALEFKSKKAISTEITGALTAAFKDAISITADGAIDLESADSMNLTSPATTLTGGTVTIAGTVSPTGSGALCGIPNCLFTGAPHTGDTSDGA
jgi:hypothetical protein